jgi:glycosidase
MRENDDRLSSVLRHRSESSDETDSDGPEEYDPRVHTTSGADSYHPGQPRVVTVGTEIVNPAFVGTIYGSDDSVYENRDHLGPRLPVLRSDPSSYAPENFTWSVAERPDGSDAELTFSTPTMDAQPRYDHGQQNVTEFVPDQPGTYVLELEAPDGVHEQTIYAFPEPTDWSGGPPRVSLEAESENGEFVVESNAKLAPSNDASTASLGVVFLADDRDALSTGEIRTEGTTARVPIEALDGESARVHAAAYDGDRASVIDTVELEPDGTVAYPNRPPEWAKDGVIYEIFTRSFHGERGETDLAALRDRVAYLDDLGVDVVWLTPVVPADSVERDLSGGGPHGYDTLDYFGVSPDLAPEGADPLDAYEWFVEACHERDIKVVFDLVINHCGRGHEFFQETVNERRGRDGHLSSVASWDADSKYFDWFHRVHQARYDDGSLVEPEPRVTGFYDHLEMPNFNFDNLAVREHLLAAADFWSGEVGVDGFRCDIAWGVPHDFWKDVREIVRSNNSEFLMLDESIPHDPAFAENEFDMHFDTVEYTGAAHSIAHGEGHAFDLLNAVEARADRGFPDHTLLINATENHDEKRLLNEALHADAYENPERIQRACWSASVALPGIPFVYYGQERQISKYGQGRHLGEGDDRENDVRPGGKQRAFMNWAHQDDTVPDEHLEFYRNVLELYHETDALGPDADLTDVWFRSEDHVLVFGRDASDLDDVSGSSATGGSSERSSDGVSGPERAVVIVNFEDEGSATVDLPSVVETTDQFSGADLARDRGEDVTAVDVEEFAVLETPTFDALGDPIAAWDGSDESDLGPGEYECPDGEEFAPGSFDLEAFEVREFDDSYQFVFEFDQIENHWNGDRGYSIQLPQVYLRDPEGDNGSVYAHPGVNAAFERGYHRRVLARPFGDVTVENAYGSELSTGGAEVLDDHDAVLVWVGKDDLPDVERCELAALVTGYDGTRPDETRQVEAESGRWTFGGAREDELAPTVLDLMTPEGVDRERALAYSEEELATLPFLRVSPAGAGSGGGSDPSALGRASD